MKNRTSALAMGAACFFACALIASLALPSHVLRLLEHPDGSYLSMVLLKHQLKNPALHTLDFYSVYVPQVMRRLLFVGAGIATVLGLLFSKWRSRVEEFWALQSTAFNLGVLRILVVTLALTLPNLVSIYSLPGLSLSGMNIPFGYGWMRPILPPSLALVGVAMLVYKVLCVAALLGLFTRVTLPLLVGLAFFIHLGPQFVGKITHYHDVWLSLAILALSPCGDGLSVDAWFNKRRGGAADPHVEQAEYGRPFVWVWCIMGAAYFFPGIWKFIVSGLDWALSDNVQLKILAKMFEVGKPPVISLHEYPLLCKVGGLATLVFEIGFPLAMIFPRSRRLYAMGGVGFHVTNAFVMQIFSVSLTCLYLSFVDWSRISGKWKPNPGTRTPVPRWKNRVAALVVGGLVVAGFLNVDSWPWSVYPTFATKEGGFVNSVEMRLVVPGKPATAILLQNDSNLSIAYSERTRLRAYLNKTLQEQNAEERNKMLSGLYELWRKNKDVPADAKIEFWYVQIPLLPANRPPVPVRRIGSLT